LIAAMNKRLIAFFALALIYTPHRTSAQFTDARAYGNTPVGMNQLELSYAYARANASLDPSVIVANANLNLNQGIIDYTYYFGLFHRLAWVEGGVPVAGLSGSVAGTNVRGSTNGAGDSNYQFAVLLKGAPALTVEQFDTYKPATSLGLSLTLTAPTGSYQPDKILNLGSDRWSFKPEVSFNHPFGAEQKWEFDVYSNVSFFTDNTSYHGREILRQQPLPAIEGHISYSFSDRVWVSLDTRYSFRGMTFLNGVAQNNAQQNFILGSELKIYLNQQDSLCFEFAKAIVHDNGPAVTGFSVKYYYAWSWHRAARNRQR
jgi:Putative MetA-pathway of phenol degradation